MIPKRLIMLVSLLLVQTHGFHHSRVCRKIRASYKIFERRNRNDLMVAKSTISDNLEAIVKDDIANDVLYFLKFYHLTNDGYQSYFYIIFYEVLNVFILKNKGANMGKQVPLSIATIAMYVFIKIIILQNIFHHK